MTKEVVRLAQRALAKGAAYDGDLDGIAGAQTLAAVWRVDGPRPAGMRAWPRERQAVAGAQMILRNLGYAFGAIDGYLGPRTDAALEAWLDPEWIRPADAGGEAGGDWGTEATVREFLGPPAGPDCTAGAIRVPWRMVLAWAPETVIETIYCHALLAPSAGLVFEAIADTMKTTEIRKLGLHLFGGCYNPRRKRGGSAWSMHAYGAAIDFDPGRNRLRTRAPEARLSRPDAVPFWAAWEAAGWTSLGRARDFDWMHVQAPGL